MKSPFFSIFFHSLRTTIPMYLFHWTLLFHIIGVGMIFASLIGGIVLHRRVRGTRDWGQRVILLPVMRSMGLFSPAGVIVLLLSGIGNITALSLVNPMPGWLHLKLTLFFVLLVLGIWGAVLSRRRASLTTLLSGGSGSSELETKLTSVESVLSALYFAQGLLVLAIIAISVIKP
jgi:hypothetical protein